MKSRILVALVMAFSVVGVLAQAEQVKKKAKDLKRDVEQKQTNQVDKATPPKK